MRVYLLLAMLCGTSAIPAVAYVRHAKPASKAETRKAETKAAAFGDKQWVQHTLKSFTARELAAQLIIVPFYGEAPNSRTTEYRQFQDAVKGLKVGGLIVLNRAVHGTLKSAEPFAMAAFLNRMQKLAKTPLIVCGDFERGASMRVASTTKYPHNMAFGAAGDLALSSYEGASAAREARALGVHWIFAPDADVNNNPDNPIINIRSYSENPQVVAAHVRAYLEGAQSDPKQKVLVTVKHFPGHGDTAVDTHIGLATVTADRARLDAVELVPFRAAIAANVDAVMTAHLAVPALEPEEIPATVSPKILTKLLRQELGFKGIIVTDAMDMQGLSKQFASGEASVRALEAGADVLLMPTKPEEAVAAIVDAMKSGRLSRKQVEASVTKLLAAKARVGLNKNRLVDLETISDNIDSPEASDRAQEVADRAMTLVKNDGGLLPLKHPDNDCAFILSESRYSQQGRIVREEIQKRSPTMKTFLLDPQMPVAEIQQTAQKAVGCEVNVVAAFVTVAAYRGNVALSGNLPSLLDALLPGPAPVALIALGSPYLLRNFPSSSAYAASFSTVPTSELSVVKALFGEIGFTGKLPVTIPGLAQYGDGIQVPASHGPIPNNGRIVGL